MTGKKNKKSRVTTQTAVIYRIQNAADAKKKNTALTNRNAAAVFRVWKS